MFALAFCLNKGFGDPAEDCNCRCGALTRAKWALDEAELKTLKDRAEYFGLDKTEDFKDFKKKYLNAEKNVANYDKSNTKNIEKSAKSGTIKLDDIQIGKSVGSKAKNYDVLDLETGEYFKFAEGTRIQNVEVFAGKGTKSELRIAGKYAARHGGKPEDWQHVKGHGVLAIDDGDRRAEVHWMQCEDFGKHDFFVKKWED